MHVSEDMLRVRNGIYMFRFIHTTENITRCMIENRECIERLVDTNKAFIKTKLHTGVGSLHEKFLRNRKKLASLLLF